ncbi:S9 family peptidase [Uliginosibacterium sp. 31-16]|uniref:S9 family peptidase n=1 Tax=Uliginosibacterium sp. 31-16 TaxID=3068315 RepID=UPI00273F6086|nr:S9 family peptidase [Uliginosibacterium sp. 31-16]MDP5240728.1 S9 family peptidase [Uliginosibacterium sp. 31-16]
MNLDLSPTPPAAPLRPKKLVAHGHTRIDPFHGLCKVKSAEVLDYLKAENAYAEAALAPVKPLQDALYAEMLARIQEADLSVPVKYGEWMYYSRTVQGAQYAVHVRKRITPTGWEASPEEILLDENVEATGKAFYEVGDYEISPSGRFLAWTEDTRGQRSYRLRVRDLQRGRDLKLAHKGVVSLSWAEDEGLHPEDPRPTLFFVTEDAQTKRASQLWRQGPEEVQPTRLFEERDERFNLFVARTRSRGLLILTSTSHTTSESRILPADQPRGRWRIVVKRRAGVEYEIDHHSDKLYIRTNDVGPNFRLIEAPLADWQPANWVERLPQRADVVLEGVDLYRDWLIASERKGGVPQLAITHLPSSETHHIAFSDPAYVVDMEDLPEWDAPILRYTYESLTTPPSIYDYDPLTRQATLLKRQPVLGNFDPAHYASERIEARATDGTAIPVSLVYRKDLARNGQAPLWLDGYGAYGIVNDPWFSATRLSLLDRGWVFAIAHVRGGGDLGQAWHEAGKLEDKRNSFTDYIACAQTLIQQGFTTQGRILANGGSAGGLLIGAVLNLAPDLFGAAILEVPFVDVLTTMLDPSLPLTVGEYEEWGNPASKAAYKRMLSYSPYDNLAARNYPPMLVEAGLHDNQVMIWEPAKYVAKLRTLKTDSNPLLFLTSMAAGHGGASGRYDALHERARQIAFALAVLQPAEPSESTAP